MMELGLLLLAAALVAALAPILFALQLLRLALMPDKHPKDLLYAVALSLDQLGGSIIYLEPDWTISSRTHYFAAQGNAYAKVFEKVINRLFRSLFGTDHCAQAMQAEFPAEYKLLHGLKDNE